MQKHLAVLKIRINQFLKNLVNTRKYCITMNSSILRSDKASAVIGADLNSTVIEKIKELYNAFKNVSFFNENLLNLSYTN